MRLLPGATGPTWPYFALDILRQRDRSKAIGPQATYDQLHELVQVLRQQLEAALDDNEQLRPLVKTLEAEQEAAKAELEAAKAELEAAKAELEAAKAELKAAKNELETAKAENLELRAQLQTNSHNSSKPPSSDMPSSKPPKKNKRRSTGKKRGGKKGHQAHFAPPPDHVDHVHDHRPSTCTNCEASLDEGQPSGTVVSHYVYELPPIIPIVHEHRCLDVICSACQQVTSATLPPEVPTGRFGATVLAMVALLRGSLRQSVRQTAAVMTHLFNVPMSTGMVVKAQKQVTAALESPFTEALSALKQSLRAHVDETSWRLNQARAWLWVGVSSLVTVFLVRASRGAAVAQELLGEGFAGILNSDRYSSYRWVDADRRQLCWSHLKRDFACFLLRGPEAMKLGKELLFLRKLMFQKWNRVRDGTLSRQEYRQEMVFIRGHIEYLLERGAKLSNEKVSGMCREILKVRSALFTFMDHDGVEPTNNAAEQALRFAVLWRKLSFGSDSELGGQFVERFLTVRETLRRQGRDLYEFLVEACRTAQIGEPAPSLLSPSAEATEAAEAAETTPEGQAAA